MRAHLALIGADELQGVFIAAVEPCREIARVKDRRHGLGMPGIDGGVGRGGAEGIGIAALGRPPQTGEEGDGLVGQRKPHLAGFAIVALPALGAMTARIAPRAAVPVALAAALPAWALLVLAAGGDRARSALTWLPAADLSVGLRVFHQKFGYGTIAEIEGNKLEIDFEQAGRKRVMDSFVTLG